MARKKKEDLSSTDRLASLLLFLLAGFFFTFFWVAKATLPKDENPHVYTLLILAGAALALAFVFRSRVKPVVEDH